MRFIKPLPRKSVAAISLAVFSCLNSRPVWAQTQTATWNGIADQTWENAVNWTPSGVPNNNTNGFTDYNVVIGAPSPTVLNSSVTIDSLTVGASGILNTSGNTTLTLNGPTLNLQGTLTVNSNQGFAGTSLLLNTVHVTGNGTINLNDDATNTTATVDGALTLDANISGEGAINAALTNFGVVDATLPGHTIFLQTNDKINNFLFAADKGGTLSINNINISQGTSGLIGTDTTSTVVMTGTSITGGSLGGTGLFLVQGSGNSFTNLNSDTEVVETGSQTLVVNGNFTNSFSLTVNSDQAFAVTSIDFTGGTLNGGGVIVLNNDATNTTATVDGTLVLTNEHIVGEGSINAALTNNSLVDANRLGHTIYMENNDKINNSIFEATNGGTLDFASINVSQSAAGQITAIGTAGIINQINLNATAVTGGRITIAGGSLLQMAGSSVLGGTLTIDSTSTLNTISGTNTIGGFTNHGSVNVHGGSFLDIVGNLANTGTITVNSDQAVAVTAMSFDGGTLSGGGTIVLNFDNTNTTATIDGTLIQAATNTISGQGAINAALTNNGTVNANLSGHNIIMQTSDKANNSLFEATNGGTLLFNNINVNQGTAGQITAGSGSFVILSTVAVTGGTFNGAGAITFQTSGNSLTNVTNATTLNEAGGQSLVINGNLANNGTFIVNSDQAVAATGIFFNGTLSGAGTIALNSDDTTTTATVDGTLIQPLGHTINGQGAINAALTNNGIVNANLPGHTIFLQTSDKTNNNRLQATNGATLSAVSINIIQGTSGQITAGSGSFVDLTNVALSGGTLNGSGLFTIESGPSSLTNVTNNAAINEAAGQSLVINGNLANTGTITVNSDQSFQVTGISFTNGTLSGTGTIALNDDATNTTATVDGTVIQSAGHTINGQGAINAILTNNGTVNANVSGHAIILQTNNKTNNSLFEATSGGTLAFAAINVIQGTAGQITTTGANSLITISNSNITGGLVSIATGGTLQFTDAASRITGNITSTGTVSVQGGSAAGPVITGAITGGGALKIGNNSYLRLSPKPVASTFSSVTFNTNSTLDITTNRVLINYGSPANDPVVSIAAALTTGFNGATWTGAGIISTTAAAGTPGQTLSVGYADGKTDFGTVAAPNQIVIRYVLAGDSNLDGFVNFGDLVAVIQNFNKGGTDWAHGNFAYGASTNFGDLVTVIQNFNKTLNPAASSGEDLGGGTISLNASAVTNAVELPEPNAMVLAAAGAGMLLTRRRRRLLCRS